MPNSDTLFDNPIFSNKELLRVAHLPEGDRIIGRDDEIEELANALIEAADGGTPNNVLIYGKTGTGKSLCTKYVTNNLVDTARQNGSTVGVAYVDCLQDSSETAAVTTIAKSLNREVDTNVKIPSSGISTSEYYQRLWEILEQSYDVGIVILDEVDKLDDDHLLMVLSRAAESGKLQNSSIGIIGISNKIRYKENLNERVKSSLSERDFVFAPYDANQLKAILKSRKDAFVDGVVEEPVIPKAAALAAKEHGDARKAIDILRYAGEIAFEGGNEKVTKNHVDRAHDREAQARLSELISKQPSHSRYLLKSIAMKTKEHPEDDPSHPTKEVHSCYKTVCKQEGADPLKIRRARDLLEELEFLSLIDQTYKGRGKARGGHTLNTLVDNAGLVLRACDSAE